MPKVKEEKERMIDMSKTNEMKLDEKRAYEILNNAISLLRLRAEQDDNCMRGEETKYVCDELDITEEEYNTIMWYS